MGATTVKPIHRFPINAFVHILSCLAAYSLAQNRGNIGSILIPALSSPYPELGLQMKLAAPLLKAMAELSG